MVILERSDMGWTVERIHSHLPNLSSQSIYFTEKMRLISTFSCMRQKSSRKHMWKQYWMFMDKC